MIDGVHVRGRGWAATILCGETVGRIECPTFVKLRAGNRQVPGVLLVHTSSKQYHAATPSRSEVTRDNLCSCHNSPRASTHLTSLSNDLISSELSAPWLVAATENWVVSQRASGVTTNSPHPLLQRLRTWLF